MGAASSLPVAKANQAAEERFGRSEARSVVAIPVMTVVCQKARALWKFKTAAELAVRTKVSLRNAEAWLAGSYGMSAECFVRLLQSEEGFAFLEAAMSTLPRSERAGWWKRLSNGALRADIRRRQEALSRQLGDLEVEEAQLPLLPED